MKYDHPKLRHALAGEYAFGILHGAARARFERLMRDDPELRRLVWQWEQDLAPLNDDTPETEPRPRVLQSLIRRIDGPGRQAVRWWERLGVWRALAGASGLAAVVLAVAIGYVAGRAPAALAPNYVAVLQDAAAKPALVVTAYKEPWRVQIEPLTVAALPPDRVFQVWAVEKRTGNTRPLVAFAANGVQRSPLSEVGWKLIKESESLAVSVEAAGARPTAPSSPLIYSGICINLRGA